MSSWFDAHEWVHDHLTTGLPGWLVEPEHDATQATFPVCIWSLLQSEIDPRGLWEGNLSLTMIMPTQDATNLKRTVVDAVRGWRAPGPAYDVELLSITRSARGTREDLSTYIAVFTISWTSTNH